MGLVYDVLGVVKSFLDLLVGGQVDLEDCGPVCSGQTRAFGSPVSSRKGLQNLSSQEASGACDECGSLSHSVATLEGFCHKTWRRKLGALLKVEGGRRGCDVVLAASETTGSLSLFPLPQPAVSHSSTEARSHERSTLGTNYFSCSIKQGHPKMTSNLLVREKARLELLTFVHGVQLGQG